MPSIAFILSQSQLIPSSIYWMILIFGDRSVVGAKRRMESAPTCSNSRFLATSTVIDLERRLAGRDTCHSSRLLRDSKARKQELEISHLLKSSLRHRRRCHRRRGRLPRELLLRKLDSDDEALGHACGCGPAVNTGDRSVYFF